MMVMKMIIATRYLDYIIIHFKNSQCYIVINTLPAIYPGSYVLFINLPHKAIVYSELVEP